MPLLMKLDTSKGPRRKSQTSAVPTNGPMSLNLPTILRKPFMLQERVIS